VEFEWDPDKSARNEAKHGIDFLSAQELWEDENRIEIHAPYPMGKPRHSDSQIP
jgi:uncharacterized DUF497 family protein